MTYLDIKSISEDLSNYTYNGNIEAIGQLIGLIDNITNGGFENWQEYVKFYDDNLFTFQTWEQLVKSETEQGEYGFTEEECKEQIDDTIFRLPCGWYVQLM